MKKYFAPDCDFLACDAKDVITSSVVFGMKVSDKTPDVDQLDDFAQFIN